MGGWLIMENLIRMTMAILCVGPLTGDLLWSADEHVELLSPTYVIFGPFDNKKVEPMDRRIKSSSIYPMGDSISLKKIHHELSTGPLIVTQSYLGTEECGIVFLDEDMNIISAFILSNGMRGLRFGARVVQAKKINEYYHIKYRNEKVENRRSYISWIPHTGLKTLSPCMVSLDRLLNDPDCRVELEKITQFYVPSGSEPTGQP